MAPKRKTIIYAEKPDISRRTKAELKPLVYMAAIIAPLVVIMLVFRKEHG